MKPEAGPTETSSERGFSASLRAIHRILSSSRKRQLLLVLFLSVLGGLAEFITIGALVPFLSILATGELRSVPGAETLLGLIGGTPLVAATVLFMAAVLFAGAIRLALAWSSLSFVQRLGHDLSTEIQRRVLAQPYSFHLVRNSSETVASLELVDQLTFTVIQQLIQAIAASVVGLFVLAGIAAIDARTAFIAAVAFGGIYMMIAATFRTRLRGRSKIIASSYDERVRLIQESIGGIRDVIVDHAQAAHVEAFREANLRLTKARTETILAGTAPRFLIESAGLIVLALLALALSRNAGGLTQALPVIGALALGAQRFLPLANQFYQGWSLTATNSAIAGKVADLLSLPIRDEATAPQPLTFRQAIRLEKVTFCYPSRNRPALEAIDAFIPRASRVALIGETGSGKSTFADLLMGLLAPTQGEILIDDVPLDAAAWQRSVAHVPQSIFLIDASIGRNIALSLPDQGFDARRAAEAASAAQLAPFLASLPDGLDTIVGERGVRLSGGQRQRIGIARALYKQAPVLILDEATSALDEATESALMDALLATRPELTMLIIAHRRSTIDRCDMVLQLDQGRLIPVD